MNEMEYNGLNTGLNSNPAGLYVYRKRQHHGNTTPGEQPGICLFYKHVMPPASLLKHQKYRLTEKGKRIKIELKTNTHY